jgi:hypothetical protein
MEIAYSVNMVAAYRVGTADQRHHQRRERRPAQVDLCNHQYQEGEYQEQQRRPSLVENYHRDYHNHRRVDPPSPQQMRVPHPALQDCRKSWRDNGDA